MWQQNRLNPYNARFVYQLGFHGNQFLKVWSKTIPKVELAILELKTKFSILLCTPLYHQGSRKMKNLAGSIMNYLNGRKIREILDEEIKFNLKKDLGTDNGKLRQNVALSFIKSLLRKEVSTEKAKKIEESILHLSWLLEQSE